MGVQFNHESAIAFSRLVATLLVSVAATFGWSFDADLVLNIILTVAALVLFVISWWKNNNITEAAQESQKVLNELKQCEAESKETE